MTVWVLIGGGFFFWDWIILEGDKGHFRRDWSRGPTYLDIAVPGPDVLDSGRAFAGGGACFVCQGRSGRLGVDWGGLSLSGIEFLLRGVRYLSGGNGPGFRLILTLSVPGSNVLASGGACFIRRGQGDCLGVK